MLAQRDRTIKPQRLHWQTGWKCLAESFWHIYLLGMLVGQVCDNNLPLYCRTLIGIGLLIDIAAIIFWFVKAVTIFRTSPRLGKEDGSLSDKPWVHLIASLLLLGASIIVFLTVRAGVLENEILVKSAIVLVIIWLINIFSWLHVVALRKLGPPTVIPTKERWWIAGETSEEEKTAHTT